MIPSVDLRAQVARSPITLTGLDRLGRVDLENARNHWGVHMSAELGSARVFSGLVPQMMAAGLPFEQLRDAAEAAREEMEHGLLSARIYAALGGDPVAVLRDLEPVPSHEGCTPLEAVLRNVIAVSCCGETVAVAVIGSERERATEPVLHEVLTRILRDEVGHARMGWGLLDELATAIDPSMKRRLAAYLVAVFERDLRVMLEARRHPSASLAALAIGGADGELSFSTFVDTLRVATVPGLERHGIAAGWAFRRAWGRAGVPEPCPVLDETALVS